MLLSFFQFLVVVHLYVVESGLDYNLKFCDLVCKLLPRVNFPKN